jgi:hypothetical protein
MRTIGPAPAASGKIPAPAPPAARPRAPRASTASTLLDDRGALEWLGRRVEGPAPVQRAPVDTGYGALVDLVQRKPKGSHEKHEKKPKHAEAAHEAAGEAKTEAAPEPPEVCGVPMALMGKVKPVKKTGIEDKYKPKVTEGHIYQAPAVHYQETATSFGGNTEGGLNVPGDLSHNPRTGKMTKKAGPEGADVDVLDEDVGKSMLEAIEEASDGEGDNEGILDVVPAKARKSGRAFLDWFTATNSRGYQYHTKMNKEIKAAKSAAAAEHRKDKDKAKREEAIEEAAEDVRDEWSEGKKAKQIKFEEFARGILKKDHGGQVFKRIHVAAGKEIALDYKDQFVVAFQGTLKGYYPQGAVGMIWFEGLEGHGQAIVIADAKGGRNGHIEMPNPLVEKLLGGTPTYPPGGGSGIGMKARTIHMIVFPDSAKAKLVGGKGHVLDAATAADPTARLKDYLEKNTAVLGGIPPFICL